MIERSSAAPSAPAVILGKYRLEREVGRGGMGVVFLATHVALEQPVAIKIVLPALAENPIAIQRVLREARCAAQITGDHVVRVMDVGQLTTGEPFIVMDYVEGEDLARVLSRSERLPLLVAVHWVIEACVAIADAHARGIIHRDLKPGNLFLARLADGRELIKVLDFGISKQLGPGTVNPVTRAGDVLGSPNYMAPEQIRTPLLVDARADLWALGAILLELLTGARAFPGDSITAVYTRVLEGEPNLPGPEDAGLPGEMLGILRRCLAKDPNDRFQTVHELVEVLAPFSPARSQPALRAIARRLASSATGGAPAASTAHLTEIEAVPSRSRSCAAPAFQMRGLLAAGALLGSALALGAAVFVAPEAVLGAVWSLVNASSSDDGPSATPVEPAAPAASIAETDAGATSSKLAQTDGDAPGAEPMVHVLSGEARVPPNPPQPPEARQMPRAEELRPSSPPPPSARSGEVPVPPSPRVRNPWDVTTFGGRS